MSRLVDTEVADRRRLLLGYLASFGAALCYGSVALVGRKIVSDYAPPMVATSFSMIFGTIMVAALFHRNVAADIRSGISGRSLLFVGLAGLASAWGVSFWYLALNEAPVVLVAPLVGTSPLISILLTHIFLQKIERVTWRTVAGAFLVVGGVALVTIGNQV